MSRKSENKTLLVGLDIGTSKVVAIVGEYAPGEPVEVIGIGTHPSQRHEARAWWSTSSPPRRRSSAPSRKPN